MTADQWSVSIPGSSVQPPGVEYYIVASDGISQVYDGTAALPHSVVVTNTPTLASVSPNQGPATGGTSVTLSGVLFQDGASVLFDGVPASDVVRLSGNQITCTTPPHFPAMVDVKIVNPDETEYLLVNGFQYKDEGVVLSMPVTSGDFGTNIELDLSVSNVTGLLAVDVEIAFNESVLSVQSVNTGTLTAGWSMSDNFTVPGTVSMSLASPTSVSGNGSLARITFEVVGDPPSSSELTFVSATLNAGAIELETSNGSFDINGFFTVSGTVNYFEGGVVPGAILDAVGSGTFSETTDENGAYVLTELPTGSYNVIPIKTTDANEITAYDASLILQNASGLISLSEHQKVAADVNKNGVIESMDASYVLQKSVSLRDVPFPGAGKVWDFDPSERSYPLLNADQSNQDFTAVLIGDVSGNWYDSGGASGPPELSIMNGEDSNVKLILPDVVGEIGDQVVVPVQVELNDSDVYSVDLTVSYDQTFLSVDSVALGDAAEGMSIASNIQNINIRIALAGSEPVTVDGKLVEITFDVHGLADLPVPISLSLAEVNEGDIEILVQNGNVVTRISLADFNGDEIVNLLDYVVFASAWLSQPGDLNWNSICDIAEPTDNVIDVWDLSVLVEDWL